jgi:membrane-associated phospholipid phosphatase
MPFISTFFTSFCKVFSLRYLWVHAVAVVGTYAILMSGFDWWYFVTVHDNTLYAYLRPALATGMLVPILLPLGFFIVGTLRKSGTSMHLGKVLTKAAALGWFVSASYKAFTGRIQPPHSLLVDTSHSFNLGFLHHGVFWGWPSSHTTVAFATMVALYFALPRKYKWVGVIGVLYALYVGIAVSFQIHWFSEFFAGMLFGSLVGMVVGKGKSS